MAKLSMHMLDTFAGTGAGSIRVDFSKLDGETYRMIRTIFADANGRTPEPLLAGESIETGSYQFEVHVADYYAKRGISLGSGPVLDKLPVRFAVYDGKLNYHVPVLFSPWGYSTYRGQ